MTVWPWIHFQINIGDIGDIAKIRLEHDNHGDFPAWHVEQVVMTDADTEQTLAFPVGRWLAEDEEDAQLVREVPVDSASDPGGWTV